MPLSGKKQAKGLAPKSKAKPADKPKTKRTGDKLDVLIASINAELKNEGSVQRGANITYLTYERFTSGSLGLDIIMGGGIPRAGIVQYKGEDSTAKTTMAMHAAAERQRNGEHVAWSASEGFDKAWARVNGCFIPYNPKELEKLVESGKFASMERAEAFAQKYIEQHAGWGDFVLTQTRSGPKILEVTSKLVRSGLFGLVVLDSAGAILSDEDDDKEVGDPTRVGGNAKIITHFINKVRRSFNMGIEVTVKDEKGKDKKVIKPNKTAVIVINQVRAQIGVYSPQGAPPPDAGGGYGLRHGKEIDVRFTKGELLQVSVKGQKLIYGRQVKAKCDKNKTASPYRSASWLLYFHDYEDEAIQAGTVDLADEVFQYGLYYGLIQQDGRFYLIEGERLDGVEKAQLFLRESPEIVETYREAILDLAGQGD